MQPKRAIMTHKKEPRKQKRTNTTQKDQFNQNVINFPIQLKGAKKKKKKCQRAMSPS